VTGQRAGQMGHGQTWEVPGPHGFGSWYSWLAAHHFVDLLCLKAPLSTCPPEQVLLPDPQRRERPHQPARQLPNAQGGAPLRVCVAVAGLGILEKALLLCLKVLGAVATASPASRRASHPPGEVERDQVDPCRGLPPGCVAGRAFRCYQHACMRSSCEPQQPACTNTTLPPHRPFTSHPVFSPALIAPSTSHTCMAAGDPKGKGGCADLNEYCEAWAASGECQSNPGYMRTQCRLSCAICSRETDSGGEGVPDAAPAA
jgi:hypothetical protein